MQHALYPLNVFKLIVYHVFSGNLRNLERQKEILKEFFDPATAAVFNPKDIILQ
jgi:hypothetical protein